MKVAVLGCGVVGSEVGRMLHMHRDELNQRVGASLERLFLLPQLYPSQPLLA